MSSKIKSLIAHLGPLGWLIAFVFYLMGKDEFTAFYLRQALGLYICFVLARFIPEYYIIAWGFIFIFWVFSFASAVKNTEIEIPFIGSYFQKWFRFIA